MKKREKVFIVIVNYNSGSYIIDCLKSLEISRYKDIKISEVIIDNSSVDNSLQLIKQQFSKIKIINNKNNLGFAKAVNQGIKNALQNKADYVFLLNPDTLAEKNLLKPLIQLIKSDKKIGIVVPALKDEVKAGSVYSLGLKFNKFLGRTEHIHLHVNPRSLHHQEEELVSGCAMLIKKEVFKKIGLFDERFFMYFEDSDFCLRTRKAGFKIYVEPKAVVIHKQNLDKKPNKEIKKKYLVQSNSLFIKKHVAKIFWPFGWGYLWWLKIRLLLPIFIGIAMTR